jgi:hypothetical protein
MKSLLLIFSLEGVVWNDTIAIILDWDQVFSEMRTSCPDVKTPRPSNSQQYIHRFRLSR